MEEVNTILVVKGGHALGSHEKGNSADQIKQHAIVPYICEENGYIMLLYFLIGMKRSASHMFIKFLGKYKLYNNSINIFQKYPERLSIVLQRRKLHSKW